MSRVALFVHGGRNDATELGRDVATWLVAQGHDVVLADPDASLLATDGYGLDDDETVLDLVVAIGGDGTVLRAAQRAVRDDAAILGINLGQLGYLAEVEPSGWQPALEGFLADRHRVEERLMVSARVGNDPPVRPALNEVVIEKAATGHTVRLGVRIDGEFFTSYVADGVIIAT
ncbi:MAG: NAD(+)/NADH kinase, partial [Acidimicrobiales bacterium]